MGLGCDVAWQQRRPDFCGAHTHGAVWPSALGFMTWGRAIGLLERRDSRRRGERGFPDDGLEPPERHQILGRAPGDYRAIATRGHVSDRPAKAGSVRPEDGFAMLAETGRGAARTLSAVAKALGRAETLVLATDPDGEGEAIAWQVLSWLEERDAIGDAAVRRVAPRGDAACGAHGAGAPVVRLPGRLRPLAAA